VPRSVGAEDAADDCDVSWERVEPGARVVVRLPDGRELEARVAAVSGGRLELLAGEPAERRVRSRRRVPRYPAAMPCTVSSARGAWEGEVIDLSELGAAVRADEDPGEDAVVLAVGTSGGLTLPAQVVAREATLLGWILHCRFEFADEDLRGRVRGLVARCREQFLARQEELARRRLGPVSG